MATLVSPVGRYGHDLVQDGMIGMDWSWAKQSQA